MSKICIGYERNSYAEQRLFISKCVTCDFVKLESVDNSHYPKDFNRNELHNSSFIDKCDGVDLIHYFNQINFGSMPFIVTFETVVPRYWREGPFKIGAEILRSDRCRKIIAFSDATYRIQDTAIRKNCAEYYDELMKKTIVMHPSQPLIESDIRRFDKIDILKVVFVGNDFLRKGGIPMLRALDNIRKSYPLELTVISDLKIRDNVTCSDQSDVESVAKFMQENQSWINLYKNLPNDQVLGHIKRSHVGVLATLAETYGYSVLEMQAAGVPVITTDIRALPEINPSNVGYIVNFRHRNGVPKDMGREYIQALYIDMQAQLEGIFKQIIGDSGGLRLRSQKSIDRIRSHHSPTEYAARLQEIYHLATRN